MTAKKLRKRKKDYESMTLAEVAYFLTCKGVNDRRRVYDFVVQLNRRWNKSLVLPQTTETGTTAPRCQSCSYDKHVELAHLKAVASFEPTATLKDINSPDNVLVLCRNCHWEFDHDLLPLHDIRVR